MVRSVIKGIAATSLVGAAFFSGFNFQILQGHKEDLLRITPTLLAARLSEATRPAAAKAGSSDLSPVDTYHSVLEKILSEYGAPPSDPKALATWRNKIRYAGIDGMLLAIGDRYTEYWNPVEFKRNMEDTQGRFFGIGAKLDVTKDKKYPMIIEPIENSPAWRAKLKPGDVIFEVDGKSALLSDQQHLDDVIKRIKGEEGTKVKLTLRRGTEKKDYVFTREQVNSPVIDSWMQDDTAKIGYIRLDLFSEEADVQFGIAFERLQKQGMKSLIFDMRNNPGGMLHVAQDLGSRFLSSGPVTWLKEKNGQMRSLDVDVERRRSVLATGKIPTVVLINGGSASASEIVSGAIQDGGAGFLIGTRSFGKGLVQTIIPLQDREGAVKITTQRYYTRSKRDINTFRDESGTVTKLGGVKPDLVLTETEKDIEIQWAALRDKPFDRRYAAKFSPQIAKGVELLKARMAGKPWPKSEKDILDKPEKSETASAKSKNPVGPYAKPSALPLTTEIDSTDK
ncbi:S41 family peptidase [Armatimonas sp.]|uniref:S41 family peptidase n=1 Tax=Armatimonas sp. TaxID=1872638 RepID=UPI00286C0500|nr:S41 family peptidase [Armatimonas sp.]